MVSVSCKRRGKLGDQGLVRAGEGDADAGCGLDDAGADFDQAGLQGGELGAFQGCLFRDRLPNRPEEPVSRCVQYQAHLVCGGAHAGGAVALELGLVQLDQVLRLAAVAIIQLIEPLGRRPLDRGDDGADMHPLDTCFDVSGCAGSVGAHDL